MFAESEFSMYLFLSLPNLDWHSFRRTLLSLTLCSLQPISCAAAPAVTKQEALYLKQSAVSVGAAESYLTSQGIRINFGNDKIYLIAKAPSWRVVLFNSKTKSGMEMSYKQWIAHHPTWNYGKADDWLPSEHLLKVASLTIDGRQCTDYVLAELMPSGRLVPKQGDTSGHLIVATVDGIAAPAVHILQRTLDLPQTEGVPLRLTLTGKQRQVEGLKFVMGGDSHLVATKSIKTVPVSASAFVYPKTFKAVAMELEVLYGSKAINGDVEQFLDAFK